MGLSKAQTGSQGKIKVQLLCGKSNGKERLLSDKREVLPCGSGGIRDLGTPGASEEFSRTLDLKTI